MRLRHTLLPAILIALPLVLSACRPQYSYLPSEIDESLVDRTILGEGPCELPCWHGIELGTTSADEAIETLSELTFVDAQNITRRDRYGFPGWELAQWHSAVSDYPYQIGTLTINDEEVVTVIGMQIEFLITVADIIAIYGSPDAYHTIAAGAHGFIPRYATVDILWLESGIRIVTGPVRLRSGNKPLSLQNTGARSVGYFVPVSSISQLAVEAYGIPSDEVQGWEEAYHEWPGIDSIPNPISR